MNFVNWCLCVISTDYVPDDVYVSSISTDYVTDYIYVFPIFVIGCPFKGQNPHFLIFVLRLRNSIIGNRIQNFTDVTINESKGLLFISKYQHSITYNYV